MFNKIKKYFQKNKIPMNQELAIEQESQELGELIGETIANFNKKVKDKGYQYSLEVQHMIAIKPKPIVPAFMPKTQTQENKLEREEELKSNEQKNEGAESKPNE